MDVKFFKFMSQEKMYENASYSKNNIPTPPNIVRDMLDLVPKELWGNKDAKVLNLACKDGNFLYRACELFMEGLKGEIPDEQERLDHIINNCLYACICRDTDLIDKWLGLVDIEKIYNLGCYLDLPESNIFVAKHNRLGLEFYSSNIEKELIKMPKFDLVIGNPPYNNDMYIDFVIQAQELSKDKVVMITPSKWQAKGDRDNSEFREKIVPYMDKIVHYPVTEEIFNIREVSGICYYLLNNTKSSSRKIKVVCTKNVNLSCDFEVHDELYPVLCNRKILGIISKVGALGFQRQAHVAESDKGETSIGDALGFKWENYIKKTDRGEFLKQEGYVEVVQGKKVTGYKKIEDLFTTKGLDKYKVTTSIMAGNVYLDNNGTSFGIVPCNILKGYQVPKGSYPVLRYFDTEEECNSFKTYYESRLVSFLFYIGACGTTLTKEFYRFIPDPKDWHIIYEDRPLPGYTSDENGIYTDNEGNKHCSLYTKYNLTPEEIDIIESVIKPRETV